MHISFSINWHFGKSAEHNLEAEFLPLLAAVQKSGSLKQATVIIGVSYRHAWGLLKKWEERFGAPLVKMNRGRNSNAKLTEFGQKLLEENQTLITQLDPVLQQQSKKINENLNYYLSDKTPSPVRLSASHDLAVNQLVDLIGKQYSELIQHQTHGSLENLKHLANAQCEVAGFHFPIETADKNVAAKFRQWTENKHYSFVHVAIRSQGLIIQKNNPKKINCLNDLGKRSVRFINRQQESGTRALFDNLLNETGLSPNSIKGYNNEEFTHVAVAAMVASGAADAGMGIHAAANQFALKFIPLIHEKYVLAFSEDINPDVKNVLINQLQSDMFQKQISKLPGYDASKAGQEYSIEQLFA